MDSAPTFVPAVSFGQRVLNRSTAAAAKLKAIMQTLSQENPNRLSVLTKKQASVPCSFWFMRSVKAYATTVPTTSNKFE
jgi:hypothetical protein